MNNIQKPTKYTSNSLESRKETRFYCSPSPQTTQNSKPITTIQTTMSNHNNNNNKTQQNDITMVQPNKPKRRSVQFGRVSYSDDSKDKELSIHSDQMENPCKFMERSAFCSTEHISCPPPSPPQRKTSAEVFWDDGEGVTDFTRETSVISMNSLLDSLTAATEHAEEEKSSEEDESSYHSFESSSRYTNSPLSRPLSPLITSQKNTSPVAPTRNRPRLGLSPSQLPPRLPTRCL